MDFNPVSSRHSGSKAPVRSPCFQVVVPIRRRCVTLPQLRFADSTCVATRFDPAPPHLVRARTLEERFTQYPARLDIKADTTKRQASVTVEQRGANNERTIVIHADRLAVDRRSAPWQGYPLERSRKVQTTRIDAQNTIAIRNDPEKPIPENGNIARVEPVLSRSVTGATYTKQELSLRRVHKYGADQIVGNEDPSRRFDLETPDGSE